MGADILILDDDSVSFSKHVNNLKIEYPSNYSFLDEQNTVNGVFQGICKDISSHKIEIMLFSNHALNKWVELYSINTELDYILKNEKEFTYLFKIYKLIKQLSYPGTI